MNYAGFQLGHPEITLDRSASTIEKTQIDLWQITQRAIALIALAALSPIIFTMWILVKSTSPGPFLFQQERKGENGRSFKINKIRTMSCGSEKATSLGVTHSDPRVTRVGKILRILKLDELPQLWNIARGDMAIVGPRPIPISLDNELTAKIPGFQKRYEVKPGLTSIGQICVKDNALGDKLVSDWKIRFQGELHYMRNRCFQYDLIMISMTILYVFKILDSKKS